MGSKKFIVSLLFYLVLHSSLAASEVNLKAEEDKSEIKCENGTRITPYVCLTSGYNKANSPRTDGNPKVQINSTWYVNNIREVNAVERYMTIDVTMMIYWVDNRITKKFVESEMHMYGHRGHAQAGTIILPIEAAPIIWIPDFYIYEMKSFESYKVLSSINSLAILYNFWFDKNDYATEFTLNNTVIQYYIDAKAKVYCNEFVFNNFPMEENYCTFLLGTSMTKANFIWYREDRNYDNIVNKAQNGYTVTNVSWINQKPREINAWYGGFGGKAVGFKVSMKRDVVPYVIQYYIPCAAIVLLTQISFIIPLTAIPGRVALLVTEFLTLINIFIHQQVDNGIYK